MDILRKYHVYTSNDIPCMYLVDIRGISMDIDENLQVVQLQESCSASKKRLSTSLSAHKWLGTVHFHATSLFNQIRHLDGNDSREST